MSFIAPAFGAGNQKVGRIYLNRQYLLNMIVIVVLLLPLIFLRPVYKAFNIDERVADLAIEYVWWVAPGVIFNMQAMTAV